MNIEGKPQDILLSTFTHNGSLKTFNDLDGNNHYENTVNVTLPSQISGEWYITAWSDTNEEITEDTFDVNNGNNELNSNNYASTAIKVLSTPSADLVVTDINVNTPNLQGEKLFKVNWTVQNQGLVSTTGDIWYDKVYISDSLSDNATKWYLGSYQRNGKLDKNGTYTGELETILSPGVAGKYVIIETDANKNVWESIYEDNNQKNADINVTSSTPSDLKVVDI
ncbi:MAG: hypothetical protein ACFCUV_21600, partial [Rivularia sp. (in: cyanobacteria)]